MKNRFSYGKCGYKLIQYMGVGIPVIASKIGANKNIVQHGENGFLAESEKEWLNFLKILIENSDLRQKFGINGKKIVKEKYSVQSSEKIFISFFQNL